MSNQQLLFPEQFIAKLRKLYETRQHMWLYDNTEWPLLVNLGSPTEKQAIEQQEIVLSWISAWQTFHGPFEVRWRERQWRRIGVQALPERVVVPDSNAIAEVVGDGSRWNRAVLRYSFLSQYWPNVKLETKVLFPALADFEDGDFAILTNLVQWFLENPSSGLYPRQLPIKGAHTKWLEGRLQLVCALFSCGDNREQFATKLSLLGLREPPVLWRMRILDPALRESVVGGVEDLSAPIEDLQRLSLAPANVFIVENLQTFLAFEQLPDSLVLLGMGFRVGALGTIPWFDSARCYYWGDLDTAGFAILDLARSVIPHLRSVLMDQQTLLTHQSLWGNETRQHPVVSLNQLSLDESAVYEGLKTNKWGTFLRLEQERLPWDFCWNRIRSIIETG